VVVWFPGVTREHQDACAVVLHCGYLLADISFEDVQFQPNTKVVLQTAASILHAAVQDG